MQRLFHNRSIRTAVVACLTLVVTGADASAQQYTVAQGDGGAPRFLVAPSRGEAPVPVDAGSIPALGRRINLDLSDVTIDEALRAIERASRLQFVYSAQVVPVTRRVSVKVSDLTVAAALTEVLFKANVDVLLSGGRIVMVRGPEPLQVGTITGHATDSISREGIGGVTITVEGTRLSTTTNADGGYAIRGVPAGNRSITARRLGFVRQSRAVTVADNESATVDFVLVQAPTTLTGVVTTATGDQLRVELGHVVGRINADSVVKAAPVSSISELLNGRVPGLQVSTYQGTVGGDVSIQIRSPSSIQLSNQPIVIVDGVRYTSRAADRINLGSVNFVEPTSPLNDLNPNEIESIEVVKGPSAATLYGTDAANGVIVVTTKRGRPGPARWNAYVKGGMTGIPKMKFADSYWGWQSRDGVALPFPCSLRGVASGGCAQDSVTVIRNALNDPQLTFFASKPRWEYGANVSGGFEQLRYFFAADLEKAIGPVQMPGLLTDSIAKLRPVLDEQVEPNALGKLNLRTNLAVRLRSDADAQLQVGYSQRSTRTFGGGFANPYVTAFTIAAPGSPYGVGSGPDQFFSRTTSEDVNRFFISATARYTPVSWLRTRAIAGIDRSSVSRFSLARRGDAPNALFSEFNEGAIADDRGRQLAATAELGATASFSRNWLSSRTAIGTQFVRTVDDVLGTSGADLPPGAGTIGAAANVQTRQNYREQVTLGSYFEQTFGLRQRLFITGALRADGASTFGRDYDIASYPKVGVSWLVSEEPIVVGLPYLDELRMRYAFGASGQQPRPEWARPGYAVQQAYVDGAIVNVYTISTLGNPQLRPEVVREHEYGLDASAFEDRLALGLTWFRRGTTDQIVSITLPPGLSTMQTNLGLTTGRGFEAQLALQPIDTRFISWHVQLQHAFHRTNVEDLGGAAVRRDVYGGWVEGYPLGARFVRPLIGFEDEDGDGLIDPGSELQFGDSTVFAGESQPPRSQTLLTTIALMDGRLRLSGLVERRSGFTQLNSLLGSQCSNARCRAAMDPTTPLAEQAQAAARSVRGDFAFIEDGSFTRLREVNATVELPAGLARALRMQTASLALQGRNLALWTGYSGNDPESTGLDGASQELGIPQGRTWALRLDFGF